MFRISRTRALGAAVSAIAALLCTIPAGAVTYADSQTLHTGTKIACVLDESVNSATLQPGTDFKLKIVDTHYPVLDGSEIHGHITDVTQPSGMTRARIAFLLDSIHLRNGVKKPIHAYVVNRNVVQYNPAAQRASRQTAPSMPMGTVTPGPIAWQMRIGGGGKPTISDSATAAVGGYVYAASAHEPIVIHAGASVTVELASDLTVP